MKNEKITSFTDYRDKKELEAFDVGEMFCIPNSELNISLKNENRIS